MFHADGEPWQMQQSLLRYSPFHSYLVPGIILFCAIGLLSSLVLWITLKKKPGYVWWIVAQGCILLGWIVVEVLVLRLLVWPHLLYGGAAVILVVAGVVLLRRQHSGPATTI